MCGICGVVGCGNADVVRRMRDSLGHRLYRPKEVEKQEPVVKIETESLVKIRGVSTR